MRLLSAAAAVLVVAAGSWQRLPASPLPASTTDAVAVWTGTRMLVLGRAHPSPPWSVDVAAAYDPASSAWRRLVPLRGPKGNYEGRYTAVWTGREMLVLGPLDFQAYDPRGDHWRRPPSERRGGAGGLVVWTGRELIDWDGRELVVFVSGLDPDGKPYAPSLARAAAYDPGTDTWRRVAPLPAPRAGAAAVWDGHEILVVGGARVGFAYDPSTNRWRRLPPLAAARTQFAAVWSGRQLLLWGGTTTRGAAYDPRTNRWSSVPVAPLRGRLEPAAVRAGRSLIVWGGHRAAQWPNGVADGARYTP